MATEREPLQDRAFPERGPPAATPGAPEYALLRLQRTAGNAAVARLLAARANQLQRFKAPADPELAEKKHKDARAALERDRDQLKDALAKGKQKHDDPVLSNTIRWIETHTLDAKLYAVRETGDSDERAQANEKSGMTAFFPPATEQDKSGDITAAEPPAYHWNDLEDNDGVRFDTPTTGGWNTGGRLIAIRVGKASREEIWRRLKHEVQHGADRHHEAYRRLLEALPSRYRRDDERLVELARILHKRGIDLGGDLPEIGEMKDLFPDLDRPEMQIEPLEAPREGGAVKPSPTELHGPAETELGASFLDAVEQLRAAVKPMEPPQVFLAQMALEEYKTEFRAYWYMGDPQFDKLDETFGAPSRIFPALADMLDIKSGIEEAGRWWTYRQHEIMEHICGSYPRIKEHFEKNSRLLDGRMFQDAVNAYRLPDTHGMNKLNSVQVNAFYEALMHVPARTNDAADPAVAAVVDAGTALTPAEAKYLRDPAQAAAIKRLMERRLTGDALTAVMKGLERSWW